MPRGRGKLPQARTSRGIRTLVLNPERPQKMAAKHVGSLYVAHCAEKNKKYGKLSATQVQEGQGSTTSHVNPLQLLNALSMKKAPQYGLMYMKAQVNGNEMLVMVDSGAIHNFVVDHEVRQLGLNVVAHSS
jgi:predicted aspartyl protease